MNQVVLQWEEDQESPCSQGSSQAPFAAWESNVTGCGQPAAVPEQLCCPPGAVLLQRLLPIKQPSCQVQIYQPKNCCHLAETWKQTKATPSSCQGMSNNLVNAIEQWLSGYALLEKNIKLPMATCNLSHVKEERLKIKTGSEKTKENKGKKYQDIIT